MSSEKIDGNPSSMVSSLSDTKTVEDSRGFLEYRLAQAEQQIGSYQRHLRKMQKTLDAIVQSRSWRWTAWMRHLESQMRFWCLKARLRFLRNSFSRRRLSAPGWVLPKEERLGDLPIFFSFDSPLVSIVVPVLNRIDLSLRCLWSISNNTGGIPYEVIVVDDGSSDQTTEVLSQIQGICIVRNEQNMGVPLACNRGATLARGEYLVFLNNDTEVTRGWLQELIQSFDLLPEAGLVGAKLIYPNGLLQECGASISEGGRAANLGRYDDPEDPRYGHAREVDYCSGACLAVRRQVFLEVGGFDASYSPAYYEDVDLAFKIRQVGKKVYCQPLVRIYHEEGGTAGIDPVKGIKRFQEINRKKFASKWQNHFPLRNHAGMPLQRKILVLDASLPTPDQDCGGLRMFFLLRSLQGSGLKVVMLPVDLHPLEPYLSDLRRLGIEVWTRPYVRSVRHYLKRYGKFYDYVLVSRLPVAAKHLKTVKRYCPQACLLFDTVDLHFLRKKRQAEVQGDASLLKTARRWKRQELWAVRESDATLVISEKEKENLLREAGPGHNALRVEVVSHAAIPKTEITPFEGRQGILLLGGFRHFPNVDAAHFFVKHIFPKIRQHVSDVKLYLVGSNPPPSLWALESDCVRVIGYVPDLSYYCNQVKVSVAPVRFGAGIRGKILTSLSYGLPVVTTSLGAEGLQLRDGEHFFVRDTPQEFAEAVVRLYRDPWCWQRFSQQGRQAIATYYSPAVLRAQLGKVLTGLETNKQRRLR